VVVGPTPPLSALLAVALPPVSVLAAAPVPLLAVVPAAGRWCRCWPLVPLLAVGAAADRDAGAAVSVPLLVVVPVLRRRCSCWQRRWCCGVASDGSARLVARVLTSHVF